MYMHMYVRVNVHVHVLLHVRMHVRAWSVCRYGIGGAFRDNASTLPLGADFN